MGLPCCLYDLSAIQGVDGGVVEHEVAEAEILICHRVSTVAREVNIREPNVHVQTRAAQKGILAAHWHMRVKCWLRTGMCVQISMLVTL